MRRIGGFLLICIILINGIFTSVYAQQNNIPDIYDYIPGEKPANILLVNNELYIANSAYITLEPSSARDSWYMSAKTTLTKAESGFDYGGIFGVVAKTVTENQGDGYLPEEKLVFSLQVKNRNADVTPRISLGIKSADNWSIVNKPIEYPDGFEVTETDKWQDFSGTVLFPKIFEVRKHATVYFGFLDGTAAGANVEFNRNNPGVSGMYVGKEDPVYDIANRSVSGITVFAQGSETTEVFQAAIVNQVGIKSSSSQNFDWYALSEDNKSIIEGITLTPNEDGTSCTVNISTEVPAGKYHIVAASRDYNMMRICPIIVWDKNNHSLYVSPDGDDDNIGTYEYPLKTIEGAQERLRRFSGELNINEVIFKSGEYRIDETVTFDGEDNHNKKITYRADDGADAIFKGSIELDSDDALPITDEAVKNRMYDEVNEKVLCIDLTRYGLTQDDICDASSANTQYNLTSDGEMNALYIDDTEQTLSQWPDDRYAVRGAKQSDQAFLYTDDTVDRWSDISNSYIAAFLPYDYSLFRFGIKAIDKENKILTVVDNPATSMSDERSKRWKAYNLLEEISLPGEYYVDRENMKLYFYPPYDISNSKLEFGMMSKNLISMTKLDNITFKGLKFAQTRNSAIDMTDVSEIEFIDCEFRDISVNGINSSGTEYVVTGFNTWQKQQKNGANNVKISGCSFFNIGQSAISLRGGGDIDTLTDSGNVISDNFISATSQKSFWEAIIVGGCGTIIRNNNISDVPCQAIRPWGNNHVIEYNEIYDCLREDSDSGVIYWGGSDLFQGTVVRYNYIHDSFTIDDRLSRGQVGIYWDDTQQGQSAYQNIIVNVPIDFNSNGAGATTHKYNTSVRGDKTLNMHDHSLREDEIISSGVFSDNISELANEIYDTELFYSEYPHLQEIIEKGTNPKKFTVVEGNLAVDYDAVGIQSQDQRFATILNNTQLESSDDFNDPVNQDYRLKSTSALAQANPNLLNTDNFEIESIGLSQEVELSTSKTPFSLLYPHNNQIAELPENGIVFSWQKAEGANKYRLIIAKDREFEDVVYNEETYYTNETVVLDKYQKFYWKVQAINISRELNSEWENAGGYRTILPEDRFAVSSSYTDGVFSCNIVNKITALENVKVFIAAYDVLKKLLDVQVFDTTLDSQTRKFDLPIAEQHTALANTIRVYVWSENLLPYSNGYSWPLIEDN